MDSIPFYISNLGPAIVRRIDNFDIQAGQTFRLRVRARDGATVLLDKAMVANIESDTLTYQPVVGDTVFTTEGVYRAWVHYANAKQDTEEFEILVFAHAPGDLTRIGVIYRAARALEPVAWDSLKNYPEYGDLELQRVIELAKMRVLPAPVEANNEASIDPRVVDFIAKKVLVDNVLHAAISFWTNQVVAQTARGNSEEVVTYPDRIRATEAAIKRYREDLERQQIEVDEIIGDTGPRYDAPALDHVGPLLTPGLEEYPAHPYVEQGYSRGWPR